MGECVCLRALIFIDFDYFFDITEFLNFIVLLTSHQTMEKREVLFLLLLLLLLYKQSVRNNQ